jgi:hypothetical protein
MAHEGQTPVSFAGLLGRDSHLALRRAFEGLEGLIPRNDSVTRVHLGRVGVRSTLEEGLFHDQARFSLRGQEFLRQVERRLISVSLGGAGITALTVEGMRSQTDAVIFHLRGEQDPLIRKRLAYIDVLRRAKRLEGEVSELFTGQGPDMATIDVVLKRAPDQAMDIVEKDQDEKDQAAREAFEKKVVKMGRLELFGAPRLTYGRHTSNPPVEQSSDRSSLPA